MADPELFAMVAEGTLSQLSPEVGKNEYLADLFFLFFLFIFEGFWNNGTAPEQTMTLFIKRLNLEIFLKQNLMLLLLFVGQASGGHSCCGIE